MTSFGKDYYERAYGLDDMRRFNMHWWSVRFYALIARRLLRERGGRRVLEVGCAHGYTLARLEREFETVGFDISEYAIERSKTIAPGSATYVAAMGEELPPEIEKGRFDLILAKYVLEHLPDPAAALRQIARLLAPGGVLLFSVPEMRSPSRAKRGDAWYAFQDETHVSLLEAAEWLALTMAAGLELENTFSDGVWDMPWIRGVPALFQYPLFCLPTIVSVLLARPMIRAGRGENLIVVASKPGRAGDSP
jgi:SAM-dependent methyltransferase